MTCLLGLGLVGDMAALICWAFWMKLPAGSALYHGKEPQGYLFLEKNNKKKKIECEDSAMHTS